jgi:hypothetical protein
MIHSECKMPKKSYLAHINITKNSRLYFINNCSFLVQFIIALTIKI